MKPLAFLALVAVSLTLTLRESHPFGPQGQLDRPGPWDNDVLVYRARGGGATEKLTTFARAGVPTVARLKNDRLIAAFQNFPADDERNFDRVAVRFSSDEGRNWTPPQPISVESLEPGLARPFDPTLVVLPDGRIRLYFTSSRSPDFGRSMPAIYSAISTDGIQYNFEPGVRFAIAGRVVIDCAATLHEGTFHLIVPDNGGAEDLMIRPQRGQEPRGGNGYHAVSRDGLNFERVADVRLPSTRDRWLGNLASDDGLLIFFGTGPGPWPVSSRDGVTWEAAANTVSVPGADPGVARLRNGSWLLAVTGPPRPGTPGAQQRWRPQDQPPQNPLNPAGGLRSHNVLSATSRDGLNWTRDEGIRMTGVSVPCAINDKDRRVLLYFVQPPSQPEKPETVACAVATDGMSFEPAAEFRIEGLSKLKAVDPSILRDDTGRFCLYYLASNHPGDPAAGANPHAIHLALSDDGLRFREVGPVFQHDDLVDPDVFLFKNRWFMVVFAGRTTIIATSPDGRMFTYLGDMAPRDWGTTMPILLPDGRLRLYAFEQRVPAGNAVRSFLSTDGLNWNAEAGDRLRAGPNEQITDPFVIPWRGGYKMYFKTAPASPIRFKIAGRGNRGI